MPTIQDEAHVSGPDLLWASEQLAPTELDQLISEMLTLRAQGQAPRLSAPETELLLRINQGLPLELRSRYDELIGKRQAQTLTAQEYQELLSLTDPVEQLEALRVAALVELAQLRKTSTRLTWSSSSPRRRKPMKRSEA